MNLTNFHSHCDFCDGKAPMEEFVTNAIEMGFTAYGISSHSPLPFPTQWNMDRGDMEDYIAEIRRLKLLYSDKIEIYAGLEIDYYNEDINPADSYFSNLPLDYRIGSVHFIKESMEADSSAETFSEKLDIFYGGDLDTLCRDYFDASMKMVENGGFDILGHCDKLSMNADIYSPGYSDRPDFISKVKELLRLATEKNIMVEINTKKFLTLKKLFPDEKYLPFMKQIGTKVVVNSDSHRPELINDGRTEALNILKRNGYRAVYELHGNEWQDIGIN